MSRKRSLKREIFALAGSMIVVLLGAVPLFDRENDGLILMIFFGAFASGIAFRNLLTRIREDRRETPVSGRP